MTNLEKAMAMTKWINNFEASKGDYSQIEKLDTIHNKEIKKLSTEEKKEEHRSFWKKHFWNF